MIIGRKPEVCPGFGELAQGSNPYSGKKFDRSTVDARISDPVYADEFERADDEESSDDSQIAIY